MKVLVRCEPAELPGSFTLVLSNGRRIESGRSCGEAELARLIRIGAAA